MAKPGLNSKGEVKKVPRTRVLIMLDVGRHAKGDAVGFWMMLGDGSVRSGMAPTLLCQRWVAYFGLSLCGIDVRIEFAIVFIVSCASTKLDFERYLISIDM